MAKRAIVPFTIDPAVRGTAGMKAAEAISRAISTDAISEVVSHIMLIGSHPGSDIIATRLIYPTAKILAISRIPARDEAYFKFGDSKFCDDPNIMLIEDSWPEILEGEHSAAILDYMRCCQVVMFDTLGGAYLDQQVGDGTVLGIILWLHGFKGVT